MLCIVVGCGLSGATVARKLAEVGFEVEIWERRDHIAGNMFDSRDEYGILIHHYGPHTFHTNDRGLYDYICRFGEWIPFQLECGAVLDDIYTPTPFNFQTIDLFFSAEKAASLKEKIADYYIEKRSVSVLEVLNCDDPDIRAYAEFLYEKDYKPYTAKQWGVDPKEIDSSVLRRVPLRFSYDKCYFDDIYQVMPKYSYQTFFESLLCHPSIRVCLNVDAMDRITVQDNSLLIDGEYKKDTFVVYTGALDELFSCVFGKLPYRSLRFEWRHENIESFQPAPVVAYPQEKGFTRITEYTKLPVQSGFGTSYAIEYPLQYVQGEKNEPYYPLLTEESIKQFEKYKNRARQIPNLYCCGRLADFKYYNMDEALSRALRLSDQIIHERKGEVPCYR